MYGQVIYMGAMNRDHLGRGCQTLAASFDKIGAWELSTIWVLVERLHDFPFVSVVGCHLQRRDQYPPSQTSVCDTKEGNYHSEMGPQIYKSSQVSAWAPSVYGFVGASSLGQMGIKHSGTGS